MNYRKVDRERVKRVEDFVDSYLSIEELIKDKELGKIREGRVMTCPFHDDEIPSMFVDSGRNLWKCHSCGRGGRFIKLYYYTMTLIEGRKISYYEALDHLLREYSKMSSTLGFNSVFESGRVNLTIDNLTVRKKRKPKEIKVENVRTIANKIKKDGNVDEIIRFISDCQSGNDEQFLVKVYSGKDRNILGVDSLMDILKDKYTSER